MASIGTTLRPVVRSRSRQRLAVTRWSQVLTRARGCQPGAARQSRSMAYDGLDRLTSTTSAIPLGPPTAITRWLSRPRIRAPCSTLRTR